MAKQNTETPEQSPELTHHTAPITKKSHDGKKSPAKEKFTLLKDVVIGSGKDAKPYKKGDIIYLTEKGKKHFQHKKLI